MALKPTYNRANQYRAMWIFVSFDLPVDDKIKRHQYTTFRNFLLKDGFVMMQYSLYTRPTPSREAAEVHKNRVRRNLPTTGKVMMYHLTDKQFSMMENFYGVSRSPLPSSPGQLMMF